MYVSVGFSDNPDSEAAVTAAINSALENSQRQGSCSLIMLFATIAHDQHFIRRIISNQLGADTLVIGGGAIGVVTNSGFGYSGYQLGVAMIWLESVDCRLYVESAMMDREREVGISIGSRLKKKGLEPDTPAILFYDAIDRSQGELRLNLATPLLQGLEESLGFLPRRLVGAGLMSDFECSAGQVWTGRGGDSGHSVLLTFLGDLRLDSIVFHGCHPAGEYYTVTKAEKQMILEIDGQPALSYLESRLKPAMTAEDFPFFMIFGVNRNPPGSNNHELYANRLCLGINRDREGIVMFESDMMAGTRFQIMYRSIDLEYIPPRVNQLFSNLGNRRPVFAFYIDCAGRTGGFSEGVEDALVVRDTVADRVPLLGIYSGVEIAPILGIPRTLDWTGVFCLFSLPPE
ncbi:MAG: FIST C-terminal domain-containing protein [Planctomycetota bacterium]|jgi:hypothetical protein|nr:FIST C-terminal domain-containing protein [Planctomycetota bacterium]